MYNVDIMNRKFVSIDLKAMIDNNLKVTFGCRNTVRNMVMNKFQLFKDATKRIITQSVMKKIKIHIYLVIKKPKERYFQDSALSKSKREGKGGHGG